MRAPLRVRPTKRPGDAWPVRFWLTVILSLSPCAASALEIKLWPFIHYQSDAARRTTSMSVMGPLIRYERSAEHSLVAVRPFFLHQTDQQGASETSILYPLVVSRRDVRTSRTRVLGLFSVEADAATREGVAGERRVTLFPFVFYRRTAATGATLSVLPFFADLHDFLGYERVRMILFPVYLQLREDLHETTWLPFPLFSWSGGMLGRGWRLWPLYGTRTVGDDDQLLYILWPLYIREELHPATPERELRQIITPFYWSIDSTTLRTRGYGPFFTHSIDRTEQTETWGFPWPFWLYQSRLDSGERSTLRIAPFYQDRHQGTLSSRFYFWPLYRIRRSETDDQRWERRDFLLVLGRYSVEERFSPPRRRIVSTLVPAWRQIDADGETTFSAPAILDAFFPQDEMIRLLWSPLWQLYVSTEPPSGSAQWSVLWDLISFGQDGMRYPARLDWRD